MISVTPNTKALICTTPIDMRSSFDSLSGIVKSQLGQNPLSGDLYVFLSRDRDRMKILLWQLDGFALFYKRLEHGKFSWIQDLDLIKTCEISATHFELLLSSTQFENKITRPKKINRKKTQLQLV